MILTRKDFKLIAQFFGVIIFILVLMIVVVLTKIYCDRKDEEAQMRPILLAQEDIITEYGFDTVLWLDAEKVENLDGRSDFLIVTCLVDEGELREYRFACEIASAVDGEIDVDTWRIKEGE